MQLSSQSKEQIDILLSDKASSQELNDANQSNKTQAENTTEGEEINTDPEILTWAELKTEIGRASCRERV